MKSKKNIFYGDIYHIDLFENSSIIVLKFINLPDGVDFVFLVCRYCGYVACVISVKACASLNIMKHITPLYIREFNCFNYYSTRFVIEVQISQYPYIHHVKDENLEKVLLRKCVHLSLFIFEISKKQLDISGLISKMF